MSLENLLLAWQEFRRGKRQKLDVCQFEYNLEDNIFQLHQELKTKSYHHSYYTSFYVKDPKLRHIHKACVKDRLLHHAVFRILYPIFDKTFIFDSYSCRIGKGTHRAVNRLQEFFGKISRNNTGECFLLKCDIKKFFDTIDQNILITLIKKKLRNKNALWLIGEIIKSFSISPGKSLPLGNVTSQLFANIYLNQLDQFMKHRLKIKHYIRYCDDFVILDKNQEHLEKLIPLIHSFLNEKLKLSLHPDKIEIRKYRQGIDFLGYVSFPCYRILRTKTKRGMFKKIFRKLEGLQRGQTSKESFNQSVQSYFGVLSHCNSYVLKQKIKDLKNAKADAILEV